MTKKRGLGFISPGLQRVAQMAKDHPERAFTNLNHHLTYDLLREAYRLTRKSGATGVDEVTAAKYAANLEENLRSLLERAKSGRYQAPPVRRVHIPKADGGKRPLGIPTFEDKVLQRAVTMVLESIYEQDFMDCSYGFRPRRSAHQALQDLWDRTMNMNGGWVLEADIKDCFGTLDHACLREILGRRVRDGVLMRLVGKWLNAGILEDGSIRRPDVGSPQGGVISPLLSNVYLHDVLDVWFETMVKPCMQGHVFLIRFADDFVLVFQEESDAQRVYDVVGKRFAKYGLTLHPEKTKLLRFYPPRDGDTADSFILMGFTHYWSKSRRGKWIVKRKTAPKRLTRALKRIALWCRTNRHEPLPDQHHMLSLKLNGHCQYYGITGNGQSLDRFRKGIEKLWRKWLKRRSGGARRKGWDWWEKLRSHYRLPPARVVHSVMRPRS